MARKIVSGVDIGGTHITSGLVDIAAGNLIAGSLERRHINTALDPDEIIRSWADAIRMSHEKCRQAIRSIGFAMPGPFDYAEGISYIKGLNKYEGLYGKNVRQLLAAELNLSGDELRFVNDATAFLAGEMHAGAASGFSNIVGITLGTGLGSAAFFDGKFEEGDLYRTDFGDRKCEDLLSARWLITEYERGTGYTADGVKELSALCATSSFASKLFEQFGVHLAEIIHHRYSAQSPETVVIGGNVAKAWDLFVPSAMRHMETRGWQYQLRPAALGEQAALVGASFLFI